MWPADVHCCQLMWQIWTRSQGQRHGGGQSRLFVSTVITSLTPSVEQCVPAATLEKKTCFREFWLSHVFWEGTENNWGHAVSAFYVQERILSDISQFFSHSFE